MLKKSVRELNLVRGGEPLPTIEIHIDSVEEQGLHFGLIVSKTLADFAAKSPSAVATVYSYGTMSVNFHEAAWSEFLIVAGNAKVLKALADAFASYSKIKSRYSDYIAPSDGRASYHIEGGRLWEVEDAFNWYSADSASENDAAVSGMADEGEEDLIVVPDSDDDAEDVEEDEDLDAEDEDEVEDDIDSTDDDEDDDGDEDQDEGDNDDASSVSAPAKRKGRLNVARADAKVSTIRRKIEELFGLPEGSVALCGPDKKRLKGNARIKTLRRRWEES